MSIREDFGHMLSNGFLGRFLLISEVVRICNSWKVKISA